MTEYVDAETFHNRIRKVYAGATKWAVNKKREFMAHVLYDPAHENTAFQDERRGKGKENSTSGRRFGDGREYSLLLPCQKVVFNRSYGIKDSPVSRSLLERFGSNRGTSSIVYYLPPLRANSAASSASRFWSSSSNCFESLVDFFI